MTALLWGFALYYKYMWGIQGNAAHLQTLALDGSGLCLSSIYA